MDIAGFLNKYVRLGNKHTVQKDEGDAGREHLDRQIDRTRKSAHDMVKQAHREITQSQRIIEVAEEAIRSLKATEKTR